MATFRPDEHIRRRADFEQTYDTGARVSGRYMTMFVKGGGRGRARLGIAATRKIGGAVIRNRAKRRARELFRGHKPAVTLDIVVVPRREFVDAPFVSLEREFIALLDRAASPGAGPRTPRPRRARRTGRDSRV